MWPYTKNETCWLSSNFPDGDAANTDVPRQDAVSPEMIAYHIARGRRLQRQAIHQLFRQLGSALRRMVRSHLTGGTRRRPVAFRTVNSDGN